MGIEASKIAQADDFITKMEKNTTHILLVVELTYQVVKNKEYPLQEQ